MCVHRDGCIVVFGNFTCPEYQKPRGGVGKLRERLVHAVFTDYPLSFAPILYLADGFPVRIGACDERCFVVLYGNY